MSFKDRSNDVQSLLALLKSTQDTPLPATPPSIPSKSELDTLLTSLNQSHPQAQFNSAPSAFQGSKRNLIEPFGPVGRQQANLVRPSYPPSTSSGSFGQSNEASTSYGRQAPLNEYASTSGPSTSYGRSRSPLREEASIRRAKRPSERTDEPGWAEMGFSKALPILSELLGDDEFRREVKKMKSDQDALERRLWAKQEKLKAEHARSLSAEQDIARIARRPLPSESLSAEIHRTSLENFHRDHVLNSLDGLALRQIKRLVELGVPGLGSGLGPGLGEEVDEKSRERVGRILGLIQAGVED